MKQSVLRRFLQLCLLLPLVLANHAVAAEQAFDLAAPGGTLAGTLNLPAASGKVPVVLIIAGSGPTDRDGNGPVAQARNDSLKLLAAALADAGFASVRYDKRGIGASRAAGPSESALRFDTYVDDAVAWIAKLKADPRFSRVAVIGHSEGSLIGMLAARRGGADAFVSIAGPAQAAGAVLRGQLAGKLPPDLAASSERILAGLEQGKTDADVPPALAALYRPSVQPYMISWLKYTPAEQLAALRVPVLVVQGTTDIQVGVEQAEALKKARPDAVLAIVPGMNHVLKEVPADRQRQLASYGDPALPLHPQLASTIAGFLRALP
jgi:pimeloyl-ACP methyl ester carboxylesterase